jgi:hypothetical protein
MGKIYVLNELLYEYKLFKETPEDKMIAEVFFLKQEASWISFCLHHTFSSIFFLALWNTVKNSVCNGQGKFV